MSIGSPSEFPQEVYRYVGRRLKELRLTNRETQAQIAQVIGVSAQQYQKYEDASSRCSLVTIYALADHYKVAIDDILPFPKAVPVPIPQQPQVSNAPATSDPELMARLVSGFMSIQDGTIKSLVVTLVEGLHKATKDRSNEKS